jgi:hypothetical protein
MTIGPEPITSTLFKSDLAGMAPLLRGEGGTFPARHVESREMALFDADP